MGPKYLHKVRRNKLQKRIEEAKKFFLGEKYSTCISLASMYLEQSSYSICEETLNRLPTLDSLLESLVAKLKGKSVYKTLKQIHEKKDLDILTKVKGVSSLVTHCVIEMQNGNMEYGILLPTLAEKQKRLISEM